MNSRTITRLTRRAPLVLGVVAFAWACGDSNPTNVVVTGVPPAKLEIVVGDSQHATVGKELPTPLVARVRDSLGRAVSGVTVTFKVTAGNGSMFADVGTSNDTGIVQDRWTLGTHTADSQRVEVRWVNPGTGEAVVFARFAAIPIADAAVDLTAFNAPQQLAVGSLDTLGARINDKWGNWISGAVIHWAVLAGGGSLAADSSITDSLGRSYAIFTMGLRFDSLHLVRATSGSLPPATITINPYLPSGTTLVKFAGDAQTGTVGTALTDSIALGIKVPSGQFIAGVPVIWGGGASPSGTVRSGPDGKSRVSWTLGATPGNKTLSAQVTTISPCCLSTQFSATAVVGPPAQVILKAGNNQAAAASAPVVTAPAVTVRDQAGNVLTGTSVLFVVTAGGGSVGSPTATTSGTNGATAGSWTLGPSLGANALEARVTGAPTLVFTATSFPRFLANRVTAGSAGAGGCALDQSNALWCWGNGSAPFNDSIPASLAGTFASLSAGNGASCGITAGGVASCWGDNSFGQIGDGTTTTRATPTTVSGGLSFAAIATGVRTTCGLAPGGAIYCWGSEALGTLGDSSVIDRLTPGPVSGSRVYTTVVGAQFHMCALAADSTAYCWGWSNNGEVGTNALVNCPNGTFMSCAMTPTPVLGGRHYAAITTGHNHTCGLQADSTVYCWGLASSFGGAVTQPTPALVSTVERFATISAGDQHTCGITGDSRLLCWGGNQNGELGNGTQANASSPGVVSGSHAFTQVSAGTGRTCGIATDGVLWCWGAGPSGGGSPSVALLPQAVIHR